MQKINKKENNTRTKKLWVISIYKFLTNMETLLQKFWAESHRLWVQCVVLCSVNEATVDDPVAADNNHTNTGINQ